MTELVKIVLCGVGSVLKYSFWSTVIVGSVALGSAGGYLILTKPEEKTFEPYYQKWLESTKKIAPSDKWTRYALSRVTPKISTITYQNYLFVRGVTVSFPYPITAEIQFYGAVQNWYFWDINDRSDNKIE